jgi:aminoglycoside phosphotransferase (APT) family kinase protein
VAGVIRCGAPGRAFPGRLPQGVIARGACGRGLTCVVEKLRSWTPAHIGRFAGERQLGEAPSVSMHPNQLIVTVKTVGELVDQQFPEWTTLPIECVSSEGTVNAIFRIGDRIAARFPLQPGDVATTRQWLQSEAEAARQLLGRTRFPIPEPIAVGEPGFGYQLPWSVQTWLRGLTATQQDPGNSTGFADDLAEFIIDVRVLDTGGRRFAGSGRGGDLQSHDEWMELCFRNSEGLLDVARLRRVWRHLRELPRHDRDVMAHGDLTPGNVLVSGGRLAGILDVGGLGPADPALDLVAAWHLLEARPRRVFRRILASDDLQWERGKAWAFEQAMGATWYYLESNPAMSRMGQRTLHRIITDQ